MACGLGYYVDHLFRPLPLRHVVAKAFVKELGAQVQLTQTFTNDQKTPIEAVYFFPVPVRSAVTDFVMIKEDGTKLRGIVEEKDDAKETYDKAIKEGKTASMMEQQTPDVFQVSVGNIPPNQDVAIQLTYSTELTEDEENDSVRFTLPSAIGQRYGASPITAQRSNDKVFFDLSLFIEAPAPISKITCPSHTVSTELGPDPTYANAAKLPFGNYARVSFTSQFQMEKDFVLSIRSTGLDAPRCIAERHPTQDSIGMVLTLMPRFNIPDVPRQEFIFLVDRSGSMAGPRITAARRALVIMLRALPHKDTTFQIASFGSNADTLWESSQAYNQESLDEATAEIDGMNANYGGTEIGGALRMCFDKRTSEGPTSVIVLTDGEVWELEEVLSGIREAVGAAPAHAYLRVYCLGIGNSASTAMCEGIARVGNGVSMMVAENEIAIAGKIARIVKAARTPCIAGVSIDWGRTEVEASEKMEDDFQMVSAEEQEKSVSVPKDKLNIFDESVDPTYLDSTPAPVAPDIELPEPSVVQQSPRKILTLASGVRLNVYAILKGKQIPKIVTLRGTTPKGAQIELSIPVTETASTLATDVVPPMHALAARMIVQDFEDGRYNDTIQAADLYRVVKAYIVRLGKTYSISSSHTSFVAVDESGARYATSSDIVHPAIPSTYIGCYHTLGSVISSKAPPSGNRAVRHRKLRLGQVCSKRTSYSAQVDDRTNYGQVSSKKKLFSSSGQTRFMAMGQDDYQEDLQKDPQDVLEKIARAQRFHGGFQLTVMEVLGMRERDTKAVLAKDFKEEVFATVCVLAYARKKMTALKGEDEVAPWESIMEKAKDYVRDLVGGDDEVEEMVKKVEGLVHV